MALSIISAQKTSHQSLHHSAHHYSIRISRRAKYMRLTVSLDKGIVVVVPESMNQRQISRFVPEFIHEKQLWISRAIKKLQAKDTQRKPIQQCQLPETIALPAIGQIFTIHYLPENNGNEPQVALTLRQSADFELEVRGDLKHKIPVFTLLERFFKQYAKYYLKNKLDQLSSALNLPYNHLTVRAQKTRWGSCSAKKNINLNYRLLFIEENLLDYILLHELVHTLHMNHSKAFWDCLESLMSDARRRDKQVNQTAKSLPCWIHYK